MKFYSNILVDIRCSDNVEKNMRLNVRCSTFQSLKFTVCKKQLCYS